MADSPSSLIRSEGSATKTGGPRCLERLEPNFGQRKEDQMANLSNRDWGTNSIPDQSDVPTPSAEANKPKLRGTRLERFASLKPTHPGHKFKKTLKTPTDNPGQALNNKSQAELCIRSQREAESLGNSLYDGNIMNINRIILNNLNLLTAIETWELGQQLGVSSDENNLKVIQRILELQG
ncbi:hypothetical protein Ancab_023288 [Ancistrocladus abbreviatus]